MFVLTKRCVKCKQNLFETRKLPSLLNSTNNEIRCLRPIFSFSFSELSRVRSGLYFLRRIFLRKSLQSKQQINRDVVYLLSRGIILFDRVTNLDSPCRRRSTHACVDWLREAAWSIAGASIDNKHLVVDLIHVTIFNDKLS